MRALSRLSPLAVLALLACCPGAMGARYAEGRVLVKVTERAAEEMLRVAEREGEPFPTRVVTVPALREAGERSRVKSWRRLIPNAPAADPTGLARVYLLILEPGAEMMPAVQAFGALSGWVEYAEPDAMVSTY